MGRKPLPHLSTRTALRSCLLLGGILYTGILAVVLWLALVRNEECT